MSEEITDIRQVKVSKVTLGLVLSCMSIGAVAAWSASSTLSAISSRLESVELQIQHFDTGLTTQMEADFVAVRERLDEVETDHDNLSRRSDSDLTNTAKVWVVDLLNDELITLKHRVEVLEDRIEE